MAPREDVVSSAVAFLQDPSVAVSPLDKRIAFLQSKNLTQEEIDISLARAGEGSQTIGMPPPPPPQSQYRPMQQPAAGYGYGYGAYPPGGPWMQPPPEPPRRDWRDWFIMATVTTGVGYGLYTAAQRYILPLISPPTPPQLSQDKAEIDASFAKAFALIDQLTTDTAEIKSAETVRTEKLDTTITEIDSVLTDLKSANTRREAEHRLLNDQILNLKDLVPKSLEQWKQSGDVRLDELSQDLQSLKKLLENRVGRLSAPTNGTTSGAEAKTSMAPTKTNSMSSSSSSSTPTMTGNHGSIETVPTPDMTASTGDASPPKRATAAGGNRAAIPAWQMAAAAGNKSSITAGNRGNGEGGASSEAGA